MTVQVQVGFTLQPDHAFLDLTAELLPEVDYLEVTPETLWREGPDGRFQPNGYHQRILQLGRAAPGKSFVAHGVGLSLGSVGRDEWRRRARWLRRLAEDQRLFQFRWYTDHLGATWLGGHHVALPVALPMTPAAAAAVRRTLRAMQAVVPDVGFENTAPTVLFGQPLEEPAFIAEALRAPRTYLLLDLHNVHVLARNFGVAPLEYVDRLDLSRVIELHVSGGGWSDPAWLPGGRVLRLDSHDGAVPEEVFQLLEAVAPRCVNLRGVTLERMEGTVAGPDVAVLAAELARIRDVAKRWRPAPGRRVVPGPLRSGMGVPASTRSFQEGLAAALRATDPVRAMEGLGVTFVDADGVRLTALLVAKLRFERVLRGSSAAEAWFDSDPDGFTEAFRRYHAQVAPVAYGPAAEAEQFRAFTS
jgi:hypothetical protein